MISSKSLRIFGAEPNSSACSVQDLRTGGRWFDPQARPILFPWIHDSYCDRIHSFLTAVRCFDNGYVGKQPVAWKEHSVEYWLKILENMDSYIGCRELHTCIID